MSAQYKHYTNSEDIATITNNIQTHLNHIYTWTTKWEIALNLQKRSAVLFALQRPPPHI